MTEKEFLFYRSKGIVNGCGGDSESAFNFDEFMKKNIEVISQFIPEKGERYLKGIIYNVCAPHDLRFHIGGGIIYFWYSNLMWGIDFFRNSSWIPFFIRLHLSIVAVFYLNKYGRGYFHFGKKRKLPRP